MSYFFYCPKCGYTKSNLSFKDIPRDRIGNTRDGYGTPIYHFECPHCHNLDAGCMADKEQDGWHDYCKHVISFYQDVRGYKTE